MSPRFITRRPAACTAASALALAAAFLAAPAHAAGATEKALLQFHDRLLPGCIYCQAPPIVGSDGLLYGTTEGGGASGLGTFYKFDPVTRGYQVLYDFPRFPDIPIGYLVEDTDGRFYGLTEETPRASGYAYRVTKAGHFTPFYKFPRGQNPVSLMRASDGNFYGTTATGGDHGVGSVFRLDHDAHFTVLHSFDKHGPHAPGGTGQLIELSPGNLYGLTAAGRHGGGAVYRIALDGTFEDLHEFGSSGPDDGAIPRGRLVEGPDGALYGTTEEGGSAGLGTVFRVTLDGHEKVLHSFTGEPGDGAFPEHALVPDGRGHLVGVTQSGGAFGPGTAFGISTGGQYELLYSFGAKHTDGEFPWGVTSAPDGNFYGLTVFGGRFDNGNFFRMSPKP